MFRQPDHTPAFTFRMAGNCFSFMKNRGDNLRHWGHAESIREGYTALNSVFQEKYWILQKRGHADFLIWECFCGVTGIFSGMFCCKPRDKSPG